MAGATLSSGLGLQRAIWPTGKNEMDLELERFKTEIDLRAFAASLGYQIDPKESWAGSAVMRDPNGDKIVIKRDAASGHYVYFSVRDDNHNGTIIDFAMHRLGCSLGAARKALRSFMGQPPLVIAPYSPLLPVTKDRVRVERAFQRMQIARSHPYLEGTRGIPRAILESHRFVGRVRIDARGNAIFPHFDNDGLCGFEVKNLGFTGFATGGIKGLWGSHVELGDHRLVVCESGIDALSFAALFPDIRTRYASIGGRPTPRQCDLLRGAAAALPGRGVVVAAMDADPAGRELAEMVRDAVRAAGRGDLAFSISEPTGGKDWNDELRRPAQDISGSAKDGAHP